MLYLKSNREGFTQKQLNLPQLSTSKTEKALKKGWLKTTPPEQNQNTF
jgi:hypothetical protein